ncbi:hypothetical protein OH77DRAFT_1499650 [Trametes cingulata]|nr:hypothetical protein OH77DRAFT_1499650 [Trametes cingulata]
MTKHPERSFHLNLGNDRRNIKQEMRFMKSGSDYTTLDFIVSGARQPAELPRTIVFVANIHKCHAATHRLREVAGNSLAEHIAFYHAKRAESGKEHALEALKSGEIRVLIATEAAAMFGVPENLCIWLQRAGRAGRSAGVQARAVMLVQASVVQKKYRKDIEEALRDWIQTEGCRHAVADTYFDNPLRGTARPHQSPKRRKDEHLKRIRAELQAWRQQTRRTKYAYTSLKAENILPDRALQTIASLQRRIIDDLRPHLRPPWPFLEVLGDDVLKLVKKLDEEEDERHRIRNF